MSLEDIKLQDKAIQFLRSSIENDRLSHSLLFFGPEAVGKRLAALTLAKTLNCETKGPSDCCHSCLSCRKINNFNHPDVNWITPEGMGNKIRIERIRTLKKDIAFKPFEGRVKIFIIDGAQFLSEEAANSILKILEEPPKDSYIILITDDLNRVFPTLRSRCQWVLFQATTPEVLKRLLKEEYNLMDKEAHFLSCLSEGRIGKAITMRKKGSLEWKNSLLDRFSKEEIIFKEDPFFFSSPREKILDLIDILISWYRDIFILKNGADPSLLINVDRIEDISKKANSLSMETIKEFLDEALKTRIYIQRNVNPKLALSNLACQME